MLWYPFCFCGIPTYSHLTSIIINTGTSTLCMLINLTSVSKCCITSLEDLKTMLYHSLLQEPFVIRLHWLSPSVTRSRRSHDTVQAKGLVDLTTALLGCSHSSTTLPALWGEWRPSFIHVPTLMLACEFTGGASTRRSAAGDVTSRCAPYWPRPFPHPQRF